MTLRLRNTLSRAIEPVEPMDGRRVRMYSCGPTVYRFAHVGNLRTFLLADLIRRVLLYHGVEVFHVQNITDVGHMRDDTFDRGEDRMLIAAGLEGRSTQEIADAYEAAFHEDEAAVNILPAHVFPRATEHIPEMIDLAERLVDAGHAYASEAGNVYFDVASFPGYGALSGNTLADLRAGHRGEIEPDKRDPADFALWKAAREGRMVRWPTERWGEGFPGWHLECSAMALRWLGERFDLHTGGIDNVFPHHEDEIAQSAPVVGGPPARIWVHGEHLLMAGRKMAKSAGNFQRVTELADDGLPALALRYLALTSRYGRKLNYSDEFGRRGRCGAGVAPVPGPGAGSATRRRTLGSTNGARGATSRRPPRGPRVRRHRPRRDQRNPAAGGPRPCARRSPVPRRTSLPRAVRRGARFRTSTCRPHSPWCARSPAHRCRRMSAAGCSSTPTSSSGSIFTGSGTRPMRRRPPTSCRMT